MTPTLSMLLIAGLASGSAAQPIPEATPVQVAVSLRTTHAEELQALRAAQQDPGSPDFRAWLTPEEFGARFGQPEVVYARAMAWLAHAGLDVTPFPNRTFLLARGRAGQVEELFGVQLLPVPGPGHVHRPDGKLQLPADLAPMILDVSGLDTRVRFHHRLAQAQGGPALGPQDLRRIYGVQPLLDQGFYGQGQQLVVLSEAEPPGPGTAVDPVVINYFFQNVSDAKAKIIFDTLPNPNGDFDPAGGGNVEFELDMEMQSVGSPGAESITLVIPPASQVFSVGPQEIVNNLPNATAVSISLGTCEIAEQQNAGEAQALENAVIQGTMEGQTWSAATGDNGSDDCRDGKTVSVDFPAVLPEVVGAGGSMFPNALFDANSAIPAYQTEVTWNQPGPNGMGGGAAGGGISQFYRVPSYQAGFGFAGRSLPDIALIAGPPGAACDTTLAGQLFPVEGTSVASPLSAGFFGLIASRIGCRLGDPHAALYALGAAQFDGGLQIFHDITLGTVSLNGVPGPDAGIGYDSATGWGSFNVEAMAAAWPACRDAGVLGAGDAGPAYAQCGFIRCDGGNDCQTVPEGPSSCGPVCDTRVDGGCALGTVCSNQTLYSDGGTGSCAPGCVSQADCVPDSGLVSCDLCTNQCVAPGNAAGLPGQACTKDTDCLTGGNCINFQGFFPGGYCSIVCDPFNPDICTCPSGSICANFGQGGQCLEACPSPGVGCDRPGYACQPQPGGAPACLPACAVSMGFDTCQFIAGPSLACEVDSGVCGGPVPLAPDGGADGGADAGSGDAGSSDGGLDAGVAPDGGALPLAHARVDTGCGCAPGAGGPDALVVLGAMVGLLRRRRR